MNNEIAYHTGLVKYGLIINLEDVIDNNPLFNVELNDTVYKICPLFNCDKIISSNKEDICFDGKCVICTDEENTILYFINEVHTNDLKKHTQIINKYDENVLVGIIVENHTNNRISYVDLKIEQYSTDNLIKKSYKVSTDLYGGFSVKLNNYNNNDSIIVNAIIDEDSIRIEELE